MTTRQVGRPLVVKLAKSVIATSLHYCEGLLALMDFLERQNRNSVN